MKKIIFIIILVFVSCKEYFFEFEPELNVHCILRNDREIQKIRISRTYRIDEVSSYDLKDVNVFLYSIFNDSVICDTMIPFDSLNETLGIYVTSNNFGIFAGALCSLVVNAKYKDNLYLNTLFGKTIIPSPFAISSPLNFDTVTIDDNLIINDASSDEQLFYIEIVFEDGKFLEKWTFKKQILMKNLLFSGSGNYKLKVFKCDKNFYDYYYSNMFEDKVLRCGVTGGIGLFGSILAESINVYGINESY